MEELNIFHYEMQLKKIGFSNIVESFVLLSFWAGLSVLNNLSTTEEFFINIIKYLILAVTIILFLRGASLLNNMGKWAVILTSSRLRWSVPKTASWWIFKADDSFDILLADIDTVEFDVGDKIGADSMHCRRCIFHMNDGEKYEVNQECGVDLEKLTHDIHQQNVNVFRI